MRLQYANNSYAILNGALNDSATSFNVVDASLLPSPPFLLTLLDSSSRYGNPMEIVEVGAVVGTTLSSVLRGQEGTSPTSHSSGIRMENRLTAGAISSHLTDAMPHQTTDTSTSKTYTYGISIQNGVVGILIEEVV